MAKHKLPVDTLECERATCNLNREVFADCKKKCGFHSTTRVIPFHEETCDYDPHVGQFGLMKVGRHGTPPPDDVCLVDGENRRRGAAPFDMPENPSSSSNSIGRISSVKTFLPKAERQATNVLLPAR